MNRPLLFLTILLLSWAPGGAQGDAYEAQATAVEQLLAAQRYGAAAAQARALVESGQQARLPAIEARGRALLGRALTDNPAAVARDRVAGIRELRAAARLYKAQRDGAAVARILERLKTLTGSENIERERLPSTVEVPLPNDDSINTASLTAIVALQQRELSAMGETQLRQVITLERQQRELDESAFERLNDSLLLLQQEGVIGRQEAEVARQTGLRNLLLALAVAVLIVLGGLYLRFRQGQRFQARLEAQNKIIEQERARSESLLHNILPVTVATELKDTGKATARRFASVSVLFADFKGFSRLAARLEPEDLVNLLDEAFRALDDIMERHGLEKIKTIGDAYMAVCGLPGERADHAERAVRAGLDLQAYLSNNDHFAARVGIHSGPVVAGVVGKHKFVYDIWGDTVNQASRLETAGEIGRVAISHTTRDLLPDDFVTEAAGTFEAKNIGTMERYFVTLAPAGVN